MGNGSKTPLGMIFAIVAGAVLILSLISSIALDIEIFSLLS